MENNLILCEQTAVENTEVYKYNLGICLSWEKEAALYELQC